VLGLLEVENKDDCLTAVRESQPRYLLLHYVRLARVKPGDIQGIFQAKLGIDYLYTLLEVAIRKYLAILNPLRYRYSGYYSCSRLSTITCLV
jgi:hypothetical protein